VGEGKARTRADGAPLRLKLRWGEADEAEVWCGAPEALPWRGDGGGGGKEEEENTILEDKCCRTHSSSRRLQLGQDDGYLTSYGIDEGPRVSSGKNETTTRNSTRLERECQ
jgi:hypothetical protein